MTDKEIEKKDDIIIKLGNLSWPKFFALTFSLCAVIIAIFYFIMLEISENKRRAIISDETICKGAIAAIFGKPTLSGIKAKDPDSSGITALSYIRNSDNSLWEYRCKVSGNSVVWATKNGPWRTRNGDEKVFWSYNPERRELIIRQIFSDGSSITKNFHGVHSR